MLNPVDPVPSLASVSDMLWVALIVWEPVAIADTAPVPTVKLTLLAANVIGPALLMAVDPDALVTLMPPLGALSAAQQLGRKDYSRLIVFSSLSKRSNVPGMRTGFVAGDAELIRAFLLYRTYHGSAMGLPVQAASVAAWGDEAHVAENRRLYAQKFSVVLPLLQAPLITSVPEGGFYFWSKTPVDDVHFAAELYREYNVTVLPGSYLARVAHGRNPGTGFVRMALVAPLAECLEAAQRINQFSRHL